MVYSFIRALALFALRVLCRLRVTGREHVPERGGVILAANHVSNVDPVVVACAVRRKVHFMAKAELFRNPAFGWFLRRLQAFPLSRDQVQPSALRRSLAVLREGHALLVFPEGTRGDGATLQPPRAGAGMLAIRSGCPVVPMYHEGTADVLPRGGRCPRPAAVRVWIGSPIVFRQEAAERGERYEALSQEIMEAIAGLKARAKPPRGAGACSESPSP
jgi:1-acyl-sn-glycerol-3-phosphate acyltransferase